VVHALQLARAMRFVIAFLVVLVSACGGGPSGSDHDAGGSAGLDAGGGNADAGGGTVDGGASVLDGSLDDDGGVLPPSDAGPVPCDHTRVDTSAPPESASWRFGGGVGYPDRPPSHGDCVRHVRTRDELEAALESAAAGDVVFVAGDARIDLTGASLCIPGGVTLASDRGLAGSAGGLLSRRAPTA
jgi:hypothetical protein